MFGNDREQNRGGPVGGSASLFPVPKCSQIEPKSICELRLSQSERFAYLADVYYFVH